MNLKKTLKENNPKSENQKIFFEKLDIFSFLRFLVKERNLNTVDLVYIDVSRTFLKLIKHALLNMVVKQLISVN